jgi:hypothetical protein
MGELPLKVDVGKREYPIRECVDGERKKREFA